MALELRNYKKGILLVGEGTKEIKEKLKEFGGRWNPTLKGWIFRASGSENLCKFIKEKGGKVEVEAGEKVEGETKEGTNEETKEEKKRKQFHKFFDNEMETKGKKSNIVPTRQARVVPHSALRGKKQTEYIYGACTFCKKEKDSCVMLFYFKGSSSGAPFSDLDAEIVTEEKTAKSQLIHRPSCSWCATKNLLPEKSKKTPKTKDQHWYEIFPFLIPVKEKNKDNMCIFCEKSKVAATAVTQTRKADVCEECAGCMIMFY